MFISNMAIINGYTIWTNYNLATLAILVRLVRNFFLHSGR